MYFVYILQSINSGTFYVGCTEDLDRRIKEHNSGLSKYTKSRRPWMLKYSETYPTLSEARKREKQIKSFKKRIAIEKLINAAIV